MIHNDVKNAVESGDISSLKYFFCDCLDGDPTFTEYADDYEYCKSMGIPFVEHTELHPMTLNSVNEEYWVQVRKDFLQNPSIERMEHMRKVARILYSSRIRKIEEENARKAIAKETTKSTQPIPSQSSIPSAQQALQPTPKSNDSMHSPMHKTSEPIRTSEGIRRASEPVGANYDVARRRSEPVTSDGIRRASEPIRNVPKPHGTHPKKASGVSRIAVALLAVVVVVIVAICLINK